MTSIALVISYVYQLVGLPAHAWQLYRFRVERDKEAYAYLQETMMELAIVKGTYKELKKAEDQLLNSELSLKTTRRAHMDALRFAISSIRARAREEQPEAA